MALSPDHAQLIHANYQFQSTSTLYKLRTHRPKCISSRDRVHDTEQRQKSHLHESSPSVHRSYPFLRESSYTNRPISLRKSYIVRIFWSRTSLNPNPMPIRFGLMTVRTSELLPLFSVVIIHSRWLGKSVLCTIRERDKYTPQALFFRPPPNIRPLLPKREGLQDGSRTFLILTH